MKTPIMNSRDFNFENAPELESMMKKIKSWAEEQTNLVGVVSFGSAARGDPDIYSDLDLVLIADSNESVKAILGEFKRLFEIELEFDLDGKHVMISSRPFVKIEFYVIRQKELVNLKPYFVETRYEDEDRAVVFDRTGLIAGQLAEWNASRNPVDPSSFLKIAHKFLYYYEGFHPPYFRGDVFRAYYQYSFAYFKLATLVGISNGIVHDLHPPRNLHVSAQDSDLQRLSSVSPVMDPIEMFRRKLRMFDFFADIVKRLNMESELSDHKLEFLGTNLAKRYPPFWQLRDLGYMHGIAPGVAFRGATLSKYTADECLTWANSVGLRTIVDLREDKELTKSPYDQKVVQSVNYVRLPITTTLTETGNVVPPDRYSRLLNYYACLPAEQSFKLAMRGVFELLMNSQNLPLLLHCEGGTDRTGMVVAVLMDAMGVARREITRDYLMSYRHADARFIEVMFVKFENEVGLTGCGISHEMVGKVRNRLQLSQSGKGA